MTSRMASLRSNGYFGVNDFLSRVRIRAMTSPARVPSRMMRWMAPFFFSSRRRHTIWTGDWSSDVCSSDLTADRRAQATRVMADLHGTRDERAERGGGVRMGVAERDLQTGAAGLRLQLGGGAAGDHAAVIDDDDPVGELIGLVEVLRGQQQRDAVGDERS